MLPNRDWIFWVVDPSSLKTIGDTGDKFVDDSNQSRPMPTVTRDVVPRIQVTYYCIPRSTRLNPGVLQLTAPA